MMMVTRKGVQLLVSVAMVLVATPMTAAMRPLTTTTTWPRTTVDPGLDLRGKMFTLSQNGGIILHPPSFSPWLTSPSYPTTPWRTTSRRTTPKPTTPWRTTPKPTTPWRTTPKPTTPWRTTSRRTTPKPTTPWRTTSRRTTPKPTTPWRTTSRRTTPKPTTPWRTTSRRTTPKPTTSWRTTSTTAYPYTTTAPARGVTVCLRYAAEDSAYQPIFTLSPNSPSSLTLNGNPIGRNDLSFRGYGMLYFGSYRPFWPIRSGFWTSLCVTVDTARGVAQVFRGGAISIRKKLQIQYVWRGDPVLEVSGFEGQLTDVEVWDFPVSYKCIQNYMTYGYYRPYRGSVLSWSQISYSLRGDALLEDDYDRQDSQPNKRRDTDFKRFSKAERFFNKGRRKEAKRAWL